MPESGHPDGLPDLFLDRSPGRRQVPDRLRAQGLRLRTLAEVYGVPADQDVADVTWLEDAGRQGWAVLMKDDRIRYRAVEKDALVGFGVHAFCLANANLRAHRMADMYLGVLDQMAERGRQPGLFLCVLTEHGLRAVDLS